MATEEISRFMKGLKEPVMSFENQRLAKFSNCLNETTDRRICQKVLHERRKFAASTNQHEIIEWTKKAIDRLDALVCDNDRRRIMTGYACHFPEQRLLLLRKEYQKTKDVDSTQRKLREIFKLDLKKSLKLDDKTINDILSWNWGIAGVKEENKIIATKIPFEIKKYLEETDPQKKRYYYCHCPRIREAIRLHNPRISRTYCYCGAGFYKDLWEKILQRPIEVEVIQTVLEGNDVCKIAIQLPPNSA